MPLEKGLYGFTWWCLFPQSRKLDVYFEYEEKLMSKSTLDKSLLDIISDPDGTNTLFIFIKKNVEKRKKSEAAVESLLECVYVHLDYWGWIMFINSPLASEKHRKLSKLCVNVCFVSWNPRRQNETFPHLLHHSPAGSFRGNALKLDYITSTKKH